MKDEMSRKILIVTDTVRVEKVRGLNKPMKINLLFIMVVLMFIAILPGCTGSPADQYYLDEAPTIRITAEALKALTGDLEAHTLIYSIRTS